MLLVNGPVQAGHLIGVRLNTTPVPAWIPSPREFRGLALALGLALVALVATPIVFQASPWASSVVVAIGLGALVLNSPIARGLGLNIDGRRDGDPYEPGLRYTGKWLLRIAIVLMGLKIRTDLIEPRLLGLALLVLVVTLPATFFVAHATAGWLRLRREIADLVAIGTMVCGASAINALAPAVLARRREQGLAVTAIFVFSVVALVVLLPVGTAIGLDTESSGLWAGLAVNDLSSSVAVGSQFGEDESLVATTAKAIRIVLLGPLLIGFSLLRRRAPAEESVRLRLTAHLPLFVIGYMLMFGLRVLGDQLFSATGSMGGGDAWASVLEVNDIVVSVAIAAVCASIGLQIHVRTLLDVGWRVVVTAGVAWVTTAGLSLGLLVAVLRGEPAYGVVGGFTALAASFIVFRRWAPKPADLRARLAAREPLTVREAVDLFELDDRAGPVTLDYARRILERVQPAIGELVPLRQSPLQGGINYRRLTFWRSPDHGSSLVGILWTPGKMAHIHSHDYSAVCRRIEGSVEVIDFARVAEDRLRVIRRAQLGASELTEFAEDETIHVVRNVGAQDAIDLHFCGPRGDSQASRYIARDDLSPRLAEGDEVTVDIVEDRLPVVMSPLGS